MKRQMKFQTKLIMTCTFVVLIQLVFLSYAFYYYNSRLFENNSRENLLEFSSKISDQLNSNIRELDNQSLQVIYDEFFTRSLALLKENNTGGNYESTSLSIHNSLQKIISIKAYSQSSTARINVFAKEGYYFSSISTYEDLSSVHERIRNLDFLEKVRQNEGGKYIHLPTKDIWREQKMEKNIALLRLLTYNQIEVGFVEVQQPYDIISKICSIQNDNNTRVIIIDKQGTVIYPIDNALIPVKHYMNLTTDNGSSNVETINPISGDFEIISYTYSSYSGWTAFLIQSKKDLIAPLRNFRNIIMVICFGMAALNFMLFVIFSRILTSPIRKLRQNMENINISNLSDDEEILYNSKYYNNEIQAIYFAYDQMQKRLTLAIEHKIQSRSLLLRAHFESLQAQINPHFIYNMLGVIANMGEEANHDVIADVCRKLAKMLRYSTTKTNTVATIEEEVNHVESYLSLMKNRYEDRLEYSISVNPSINSTTVPKLILQPVVENSISHGFKNSGNLMKISILGEQIGDKWCIKVSDNGSGMDEVTLENLKEKINQYSQDLKNGKKLQELEIGGMGIVSTFTRLMLMYGDMPDYEIGNNLDGGAFIKISGHMQPLKGG